MRFIDFDSFRVAQIVAAASKAAPNLASKKLLRIAEASEREGGAQTVTWCFMLRLDTLKC